MYDPAEEPEPDQDYDWDAWAERRWTGRSRWWLLWAVAMMAAMTVAYLNGKGMSLHP